MNVASYALIFALVVPVVCPPAAAQVGVDNGANVHPNPSVRELPELEIVPADIDPSLFFGPRSGGIEHYGLGPDDVLEIKVFDMAQFDLRVRVSGSGTIDLPLIGLVDVQGLVPDEAADRVAERLRDEFVKNPQVSVFVHEFNSRKLSLIGEVERPATYPRLAPRSLLQLLADAGGLTDDADDVLYVFREASDGRRARLRVPLRELLVLGDPRWDIWLLPGDVVSVPPKEYVAVSVLGAVNQPGIYQLPRRDPTLLNAIASANGLSRRASRKKVEVKRRVGDTESKIIEVNLDELFERSRDFLLQEGDVVFVNEKFF